MSIQILKDLALSKMNERYSNVPIHARPAIHKYSDVTANGLEKAICDWINFNGGVAERVKNQGRCLDNTKQVKDYLGITRTIGSKTYIPGTGTNGSSDVHALILTKNLKKSISVKIEVKIKSDKLSKAQKEYRDKIEAAGGLFWEIKTFSMFMTLYDLLVND